MLQSLRSRIGDSTYDGTHALLLWTGAILGLLGLTFWSMKIVGNMPIPAILQNVLPWQMANVQPEPWEGTLLHAGLIVVPLVALLVWVIGQSIVARYSETVALRIAAVSAVLATIIWLLVIRSIGGELHEFIALKNEPAWRVLIPMNIGVFIAMIATTAILFFRKSIHLNLTLIPQSFILEGILITLFSALLAFDPTSLSNAQPDMLGDAGWFLLPVHDILHGRQLLVASESQYGLGIFYLMAPFFRMAGTSIASLSMVMMLVQFLYYILLYVLVRLLCLTRRGAVLAFLFCIGWSLMHNELRFEIYAEPSVGRLRNIWDMPVLLCMLLEYGTQKKKWFLWSCIATALAFLYNADIGLSLALTAAVWAVAVPLFEYLTLKQTIISILKRLAILAGSLIVAVGLFTLIIRLVSGEFPNWALNTQYVSLYMAGFGAMPMPVAGAYWLVLSAYSAAVIAVLFAWLAKRPLPYAPYLLTLAAYGFLSFHYYLNRSFISNVWVIALPALLCFVILGGAWWQKVQANAYRDSLVSPLIRIPLLLVAGICMGIALWSDATGLIAMIDRRYIHLEAKAPTDPAFLSNLDTTLKAIDEIVPETDPIAVLSPRESMFLLAADRASAFHVPMLETVFTIDKLSDLLRVFLDEQHPYLFVEHDHTRCPVCDASFQALQPYYTLKETKGLFDIYTLNR